MEKMISISEKDLKSLQDELKFFRSIDFIAMSRFIEYDKQMDLTGWEFLADGWRKDNEAKCLWYIQQRWNKNFHYSEIFDKDLDTENREFRSMLSHFGHLMKMYKEKEEE